MRQQELSLYLEEISEKTATWTRNLGHSESAGKVFSVEPGGRGQLSIIPSYNAGPFYSLQGEVPDDQGLIIVINERKAHRVMR